MVWGTLDTEWPTLEMSRADDANRRRGMGNRIELVRGGVDALDDRSAAGSVRSSSATSDCGRPTRSSGP